MKFSALVALVLFCLPGLLLSQTKEELGRVLFPDDPQVEELFNMFDGVLTKEKLKRFYKIVDPGRKSSRIDKGMEYNTLSGTYNGMEVEQAVRRFDMTIFTLSGSSVKLFGSSNQSKNLEALKKYPNLFYETLEEKGGLTGFLLPQIKGTVLLEYKDGTLTKIKITKERYTTYKRVLVKKELARAFAKKCSISGKPFSLFEPVNLASLPKTTLLNLEDDDKNHMLYGDIHYQGPLKDGLPQGSGKWALLDSCSQYFSFKNVGFIAYGNFENGKPHGWHELNADTARYNINYNQGVFAELKDYPMPLPFNGLARMQAKVKNGKLNDPNAFYITGNDYKTPMPFVNGNAKPTGEIKYYNKTGQFVTLSIAANGKIAGPFLIESKTDRLDVAGIINADGNIDKASKVIKIGYWDIRNKELYPQKAEVRGNFEVDLVNANWGGENLTVTFPGTDLVLRGTFLAGYGFTKSAAPHGTHTLVGTYNGKKLNLKGEYENGLLVSGDTLYNISSQPPSKPTNLNFDRVINTYSFPGDSLEIPVQEAKGIGIERVYYKGKEVEVEVVFKDANGKKIYASTIKAKLIGSKDFSSTINNKRSNPIKSVVIRRNDYYGHLKVYTYNTGQ